MCPSRARPASGLRPGASTANGCSNRNPFVEGELRKPAPQVVLEGIEGGSILFIARGFVISPRSVEDVLNAVLFDALVRLNAAGITLARTTAVVMKQSGPVDERT